MDGTQSCEEALRGNHSPALTHIYAYEFDLDIYRERGIDPINQSMHTSINVPSRLLMFISEM